MANFNKVMLMGNLTRDPEVRYTANNLPVAHFGIATNRRWRNQQGEQQEETTFVDCTAFGRTGEIISQYMQKGRPLFVEGRLRLDQWQDRDGNNRSKHEVIVETFQFIDGRGGGGGQQPSGGEAEARPSPQPQTGGPAPADSSGGPTHHPVEEDDIPF